jgi:hypothetical protein
MSEGNTDKAETGKLKAESEGEGLKAKTAADRTKSMLMAKAAACYAYAAARQFQYGDRCLDDALPPEEWPYEADLWTIGVTAHYTLVQAGNWIFLAATHDDPGGEKIPSGDKVDLKPLSAADASVDPDLFLARTRLLKFGDVLAEGDFVKHSRLGDWVPVLPDHYGKIIPRFNGWYRRPFEGIEGGEK